MMGKFEETAVVLFSSSGSIVERDVPKRKRAEVRLRNVIAGIEGEKCVEGLAAENAEKGSFQGLAPSPVRRGNEFDMDAI